MYFADLRVHDPNSAEKPTCGASIATPGRLFSLLEHIQTARPIASTDFSAAKGCLFPLHAPYAVKKITAPIRKPQAKCTGREWSIVIDQLPDRHILSV
jgi:hypothetical protein